MATETFEWCPRITSQVDITLRTRKAQFGDAYAQVAGDGINPKLPQWSVSFTGDESYILAIKAFIERHGGWKSFRWKPPLEPEGLYRADTLQLSSHGNNIHTLSSTFIQAYHP